MCPAVETEKVIVTVSADRMTASVSWCASQADRVIDDDARPAAKEVLDELERQKVPLDDEVRSRVDEFISEVGKGQGAVKGFVVAEGRAPAHARDAELVWVDELANEALEWKGDAEIGIYPVHMIANVAAGTTLGHIRPMEHPKNGVDLFGKTLQAHGTPGKLHIGAGLSLAADDATRVEATASGRIIFNEGSVSIEEADTVSHDLESKREVIRYDDHVHLNGAISDRVTVACAKSLTVTAGIDAAVVRAGGDVVVRGGIVGRGSGCVRAGGRVIARYCNEANILAEGDVIIGTQLMNSCVAAGRKLVASDAALVGGRLFARDGVELDVVGSEAEVDTRVFLGVGAELVAEAFEVAEKVASGQAKTDKLRRAIEPLLQKPKSLSREQYQRVMDLATCADKADSSIDELDGRRKELLASALAIDEPALHVRRHVFPGVTIRLGDRETVIQKLIEGPIIIRCQKVDNVTEIVVVRSEPAAQGDAGATGEVRVLNSQRIPEEELANEPVEAVKRCLNA